MKPSVMMVLTGGKGGKGAKANPPEAEEDDEAEGGEDPLAVSKEQVRAAKAVRGAGSDEDYAKALKAFLKLC